MSAPVLIVRVVGGGGPDIRLFMGDGEPTLTGGAGGWETVSRPGRIGLVRYGGVEPISQDVPFLLDGYAERRSVARERNQLVALSRPSAGRVPGAIRVLGPIHFSSFRWVLTGITWGPMLQDETAGLLRQAGTLHLTEWRPPDQIRLHRRPQMAAGWGARTHTVRKGDTWRKLAAKYLGNASRWKELARKNGNKPKSPGVELKPGRRVRV